MCIFRLSSLRKARIVLMQIYGESEQTAWLPKGPGFSINNRLSSMVCVILCSQPSSSLRQCRSSYMMKLQGLIATARSLFGGHRPTFGFDVLPFVGVALFPNPSHVGVVLFPSPAT